MMSYWRIPHGFGRVITTHAIFKVDLPPQGVKIILASYGLAKSWEDAQTSGNRWEKVPCELEKWGTRYEVICRLFCIYGKTVLPRSGTWRVHGGKVRLGIFFWGPKNLIGPICGALVAVEGPLRGEIRFRMLFSRISRLDFG